MKKLLLIFSILFFSWQNILAQTPHFRNYTVDDGLPSSHVYRAFQDSKGFIWFCTDKGLARFDGYKFEKFTTKNGLPNNDIWQCAEDSEQRIWFLSYANAFFYFDLKDNQFHVIENPYKEYHDTHVWSYVEEKNGLMKVFMSGTYNLLQINLKKQKVVNHITIDPRVQHSSCYPLKDSVDINMGRNSSTSNMKSSGAAIAVRIFSEGLQHNIKHHKHISPPLSQIPAVFWYNAISVIFDDDKTIYADNDSISLYKNNKFHSNLLEKLSTFKKNDNLSLILNTGNLNRKLVRTDKDAFIIDENINRLKEYDFIKNFNVNTIYFDDENNIWICTKDKGIFLLSKKSIYSDILAKLSNISISTLAKDNLGRLWIGSTTGKIYFINNDGQINEQKLSYSPNMAIKRIVFTSKNILIAWNGPALAVIPIRELSKNHEIFLKERYLNLSNEKDFFLEQNTYYVLKNLTVRTVDTLGVNQFIFGTSNKTTTLLLRESKFSFNTTFPPLEIKCNALITLPNQNVMIGANKGLFKYTASGKLESYTILKQKYPILTKPISCFGMDSQKGIWVGTDGFGVYRFYNNQVQQIPELTGIIVNYLIAEKQTNRIWIATNEGIFLLKTTDSKADVLTYQVQKISLAQGLPTLEVNTLVVRNNKLFAGTSKGLAMLPIENIIESERVKSTVPLIIRNIKINRKDTTVKNSYDLTYTQNNIDIEFVALSYKSDRNIKYDYKMISSSNVIDTSWHSVQDLHKEFSLLAPGKYTFYLRAFDINGYPTQSVKPITFIISPPFWDTFWFKLLVISLILGAIILYFLLRTRNIKKNEEQKTEINKKFAELELQALQAQMNPHFVFNALSAIQNFILNNNAEQATDYLSRFSRLMRLFLESSRNKYISLSDEKMLLEHYIELEQLRFKDKFDYKIHVDESVSLDAEVPSMLLQPFVENAINHGLVYKKENGGLLDIIFKKENNKLFCIVEDNGIGRQKAAEIKSKSLKPYKSRGTEITEERLRSLELVENTKIEVNILDKKDETHQATGTKVTIIIYL